MTEKTWATFYLSREQYLKYKGLIDLAYGRPVPPMTENDDRIMIEMKYHITDSFASQVSAGLALSYLCDPTLNMNDPFVQIIKKSLEKKSQNDAV